VYYLKIQDFDIQKHKRLLVQFMIVQAYIHCKENGNETARMTGTTRTTVTRILEEAKKSGLLYEVKTVRLLPHTGGGALVVWPVKDPACV
jgi:DNA invertase Pin-like site-specific DNA recombinase